MLIILFIWFYFTYRIHTQTIQTGSSILQIEFTHSIHPILWKDHFLRTRFVKQRFSFLQSFEVNRQVWHAQVLGHGIATNECILMPIRVSIAMRAIILFYTHISWLKRPPAELAPTGQFWAKFEPDNFSDQKSRNFLSQLCEKLLSYEWF